MKRKTISRTALVASIVLIFVWIFMGTTSSLAWFKDEDELVNNLYFGDLKVEMYYKNAGSYRLVDASTHVFDDEALYEPGYTQVVYFRVDNKGTVPFTYELSVVPDITKTVYATSVLGNKIDLTDYVKFGLVLGSTEQEVMDKTADRDIARSVATEALSNYSVNAGQLDPDESGYAAIVVFMPEEVANEANYRGDTAPEIQFGISAKATQLM